MPAKASTSPGVVIIGPVHPYRGGIAHYTACLAQALERRGTPVEVINYKSLYLKALFPGTTMLDHSSDPLSARHVQILRPLFPWTWVSACLHIRRMAPKAVVVQWWHVFFAPCLLAVIVACRAWLGVPVAVLCHNVNDHEDHGLLNRIANRLLMWTGAALIVHSAADAAALRRRGATPDVFVTQHPTYDVFRPDEPPTRDEARRTLGLPSGPLCLFFGVVRRYKGLEDLLEALALTSSVPPPHLVVAGEFYEPIEKFRTLIRDRGLEERVTLVNRYVPNEEVGAYFIAADVLVVPYRSASQSGVVRIANSFALPAIVTDAGGLPEMIEPGRTGLVVPQASPAELAGAIDRFFSTNLTSEFRPHLEAQSHRHTWEPLTDHIRNLAASASA